MTNQRSNNNIIYNGEIVAGSLLITESRKIARLLLDGADETQWHQSIVVENVLQKRSPVAAKRHARLIRNRLISMGPDLWQLVCTGPNDVSVQALLSAAVKHSRLLGDFMEAVVKKNWLTFSPQITVRDWKNYLETCAQIDPKINQWTDLTKSKLKQIVFRILAESKYIDGTRSGNLQTVSIVSEVKQYLLANSENYVLSCMEATQ